MKKMGDVIAQNALIHTIEVPAKYKRHARRYIESYMSGYLKAHEKRQANRALEAKWNALNSQGGKVSHVEADYREHGTAERHCARCSMYQGIDKCSAVVAPISPQAVCKLFEKRESRVQQRLRRGV